MSNQNRPLSLLIASLVALQFTLLNTASQTQAQVQIEQLNNPGDIKDQYQIAFSPNKNILHTSQAEVQDQFSF